jgi:hypothetical protein
VPCPAMSAWMMGLYVATLGAAAVVWLARI